MCSLHVVSPNCHLLSRQALPIANPAVRKEPHPAAAVSLGTLDGTRALHRLGQDPESGKHPRSGNSGTWKGVKLPY